MKLKITTLESWYTNDAMFLLSQLRQRFNGQKTIITYDGKIELPKQKRFYAISIQRKGREYHGFINNCEQINR